MRNYFAEMEAAMDLARARLAIAVEMYPDDDYCARAYYCVRCQHIDVAVAPSADLPDDYACPSCGHPQEATTPLLDLYGVRT